MTSVSGAHPDSHARTVDAWGSTDVANTGPWGHGLERVHLSIARGARTPWATGTGWRTPDSSAGCSAVAWAIHRSPGCCLGQGSFLTRDDAAAMRETRPRHDDLSKPLRPF
jgi:hypothetical protein